MPSFCSDCYSASSSTNSGSISYTSWNKHVGNMIFDNTDIASFPKSCFVFTLNKEIEEKFKIGIWVKVSSYFVNNYIGKIIKTFSDEYNLTLTVENIKTGEVEDVNPFYCAPIGNVNCPMIVLKKDCNV